MKQTVLVVGGTSGMGFASAQALLQAGYDVTITGRSEETVARALVPLAGARGRVLRFEDSQTIEAAVQAEGRLDHLVLIGSGAPCRGNFDQLSAGRIQQALDDKWFGYLACTRAALPVLAERGSITVVTGGASRVALPGTSIVAGINAGLQAWALVLAKELAPRRVNVLSPGFVDTPLHDWMDPTTKAAAFQRFAAGIPVGRVGRPEEIASAVAFLVGNEFTSGVVLDVDGGGRLR